MAIINKKQRGISVVEILVAVAIIGLMLTVLLGTATVSLQSSILIKQTTQASSLAQGAIEAVRNFRDGTTWDSDGIGTLTTGIAYYAEKTTSAPAQWTLIQGEEAIDNFTRKIVFSDVSRDGNDDIVASGGTNDPNTKKAVVAVSWEDQEVEIVTYFTNWR